MRHLELENVYERIFSNCTSWFWWSDYKPNRVVKLRFRKSRNLLLYNFFFFTTEQFFFIDEQQNITTMIDGGFN